MLSWVSSFLSSSPSMDSTPDVVLTVNGVEHTVPTNLASEIALCDYLRDYLHLTGTKFTCREGSCGACAVNVRNFNPIFKEEKSFSVNSCLLSLYACAGFDITTVEGIGDRQKGYHSTQERLADYNGTQCGFCSPGMVMTMYSLLENKHVPEVKDVEDLFDGNICRCTGYRSILDAMKSFSGNNKEKQLLELLMKKPCMNGPNRNGVGSNSIDGTLRSRPNKPIHIKLDDAEWFRPMLLDELYQILQDIGDDKIIRLVVGNTSNGIFKDSPVDVYIDIKGILELYQYDVTNNNCTLGANATLNDLIEILQRLETSPDFAYCETIARHIKQVANVHARNIGCWAGNIMTKKLHPEFPSDIFVLLEAVGAQITMGHYDGSKKIISPLELLSFNATGWVILNLQLKGFSSNYRFNSYKIMPRSQSAQAYVNGAFLMEIDSNDKWRVLSKPSIVYGGIHPGFTHAFKTEEYLTGKQLGDSTVLQESLTILDGEINPDSDRIIGSVGYRKQLAIHLYYKFLLGVLPEYVSPKLRSGANTIDRPISSGTQTYDTNESEWPLNQPIQKLEAKVQCSGEAEYIMDIPKPPNTLYGAFVLSTVGNAFIKKIDPSDALKIPGVVRILTAKDVPGQNNVYPMAKGSFMDPEELFSSGRILYAGQSIALVVADSQVKAELAAKAVNVTYENVQPPIITIDEAIKNSSTFQLAEDLKEQVKIGNTETALKDSPNVLKGEVRVGTQYHLHLETQIALCIPTEDGMDVSTSTQWLDGSQQSIAQVLDIKKSSFNLQVRRLGGAYGGKISRNVFTSAACALAAHVTNRPVYLHMDLSSNLEMLGKRSPLLAKYEVGFDDNGKLEAVKIIYYFDAGCHRNETVAGIAAAFGRNVYDCPNWLLIPKNVLTNLPSNTYVRTPGTAKGIFVTEVIMEHIAKHLKKNPLDIKALNMISSLSVENSIPGSNIRDLYSQLRSNAEVDQRLKDIHDYNENNRWKKRGLSIVPMEYNVGYGNKKYNAIVSIYKGGGAVAVSHGGIECGQGINTKVAQVCAYELGIPLDLISVKATNTLTNPNANTTGGSTTSELNCKAAAVCCVTLVNRMQPIRDKLKNPTWEELVEACYNQNVDLCARHMYGPADSLQAYSIYAATCAEAEIDVLTGEHEIRRVDMLFDCGQSISPEIDIGQIEGAFVMGMGLFLSEEVKYDPKTGRNLTNNLWDYFPPTSKDIPADFRITLLKNAPNPFGVLKSKTAGEPPLCMSSVVLLAIQSAIHSAREETGDFEWTPLNSPATVDSILLACNVKKEQLTYT